MQSIIISLFTRLSNKVQKHIIRIYSQKSHQNTKKIELMNGEARNVIGVEDDPQNVCRIKNQHKTEIILIAITLIVGMAIKQDSIIINTQITLFLIILILILIKIYSHKKTHKYLDDLQEQDCYILNKFTQNHHEVNDSLTEFHTYFNPQLRITTSQLKIGDILILECGNECPADVLLLESSTPQITISQENFGHSETKKKIPCSSTFVPLESETKGLMIEMKLSLNGSIFYNYLPGRQNSLQGSIKLKNDPKSFKFNETNIIYRGEILINSDWAIGIVLVDRKKSLCIYKPSVEPYFMNLPFDIIIIVFIVVAWLLSLFEYIVFSEDFHELCAFNTILIPQFLITYRESSILFNQYHSSTLTKPKVQIRVNSSTLHKKGSILQQDDKKVFVELDKVKQFRYQTTESQNLGTFSLMVNPFNNWQATSISLVCIEISDQYCLKAPKLKSFYVDDKQYNLSKKQLRKQMEQNSNALGSNYQKALLDTGRDQIMDEDRRDFQDIVFSQTEEKLLSRQNEILTNSFDQKPIQQGTNKKLSKSFGRVVSFKTKIAKSQMEQSASINQIQKQILSEDKLIYNLFDDQDNQYHEKIVAMLLLCQIENKYDEKKKQIEIYPQTQDDGVILDFGNVLEYKLKCNYVNDMIIYNEIRRITKKVIEIQGKLKQYQILYQYHQKNKVIILLKDPEEFNEDEGTLLYIKIDNPPMFENSTYKIDINQLNSNLYYMLSLGQKPIIYLKKQLSKLDAIQFLENMKKSDNLCYDEELNQIENGAELLGIIGIKRKISSQILSTINKFEQAHMKLWFISTENYLSILRNLFSLRIVENEDNLIIFDQIEERKVKFQIELACAKLVKQQGLFEKIEYTKKYLVIHGNAFQTICKNDNLLKHFTILCKFSRGLTIYSVTEKTKSKIYKLANNLNYDICYIGNSYDNQRVYDRSRLSIQLSTTEKCVCTPNFIFNNLTQIEQLVLIQSLKSNKFTKSIIYYWLYEIILISLIKLTNQDFSMLSLIILIFFHQGSVLLIQIIDHLSIFKIMRQDILLRQRSLIEPVSKKMAFIRICSHAVIDAILISCPLYTVRNLYSDVSYLPFTDIAFITTLTIVFQLDLAYQLNMNKWFTISYQIISILIIFSISLLWSKELQEYQISYEDYFYSPGYIIRSLLFIYLFCYFLKFVSLNLFSLYDFDEYASSIPLVIKQDDFENIQIIRAIICQKYQNKPLREKILNQLISYRKRYIQNLIPDVNKMDDSLYKAISNNQLSKQQMEMKKSLQFIDNQQEQQYQEFTLLHFRIEKSIILMSICYELIIFINLLIQIIQDNFLENNIALYILWGFMIVYSIIIILLNHFEVVPKNILVIFERVQLLLRLILYILHVFLLKEDQTYLNLVFLYILTLSVGGQIISVFNNLEYASFYILVTLIILIKICIPPYDFNTAVPQIFYNFQYAFIFISFMLGAYLRSYVIEYFKRWRFILQQHLEQEQKKLNEILGLVMPKFITDRMTRGYIHIQEDQGNVTILFCDICDFEDVVEAERTQIIILLDRLYRHFDQIVNQCNVQKIETVGKTYLCAAGLKDYDVLDRTQKTPTQRILECAIMMMEAASKYKYGEGLPLIIKVGINYGQVMAGVIGSHKPQFSLIGDTVNTTSRVCSTGSHSKITLSESAYNKVKHLTKYNFTVREVFAKGKGMISTYQLNIPQQKSSFYIQRADKAPVIKLVSSIPLKNIDEVQQKSYGDGLQNAVNPLGFSITQVKAISSPERAKAIHDLVSMIQPKKINAEQPQSYRRQTVQRKTRMTRFKDLNPFLKNSQQLKISNILGSRQMEQHQVHQQQQQINDLKADPFDDLQIAESQRNLDKISKQELKEDSKLKEKEIERKDREKKEQEEANKLFESTVQQEEKIEIPKVQRLIGNQEKIESDIMQELVKMKCSDSQFTTTNSTIFEYYSLQEKLNIYSDYLLKEKFFYSICLFVQLLFYQIIIINLISENSVYAVQLTMLLLKIVLLFVSSIMVPYCCRGTYHQIVEQSLIITHVIQAAFQLAQVQLYIENLQQIYVTSALFSFLSINYYLRQVPFMEGYHIKILYIIEILYVVINFSLNSIWNESIIFLIFMEGPYLMEQLEFTSLINLNYSIHLQQQEQKQQQEKIISNLLPPHILTNFINNQDSPTDIFENATILFADIAGFTKYSASVDAQQVLQMLSSLFNKFDQSCAEFDLYKLYTIGDCYVVMGILDAQNGLREEEAYNVVNFGFRMIEIINQLKQDNTYQHLNMRIGIHTGTIIGGIVGTDVVRYDIYGEDVAIANKMESNGEQGRIMISENTMNFLEATYNGSFTYTLGKEVATTKGVIQGYFIERVLEFDQ